jgi:hypothetical protein
MLADAPTRGARTFQAKIWSGVVEGPGLYLGTPEAIYHADPCPEPSLSSHIAKIALKRSVRHAQVKHPRFAEPVLDDADEDDDEKPTPAAHLLIGAAAHSLTLGAGAPVVEVKVKKFTTKDARRTRRLILDSGGIPLKTKHYRIAQNMARIARPVLIDRLGGEFVPEAMIVWQERGQWRRGLVDASRADLRHAIDYKTSGRPCPPEIAARFANSNGYPFQEGFYRRGFDALDPAGRGRRKFEFMFQEVEEPHAISFVECNEANRSLADEQVEAACNIWDRAMITGEWPAYSLEAYSAAPAPWDLTTWEERAMTDNTLNPMEIDA